MSIIKRSGVVLLWLAALLLLFAGINNNDPYMVPLRGTGNTVLVVTSIAIVVVLIRRGIWRSRGIAGRFLLLLWCLPPLAMLGAHISFEIRKRDALQTETAEAIRLGRHFVVGYTSFAEVATLAEKGLIAGVYVTRHNVVGRTANEVTAEIAALQQMRHAASLPPLIVAADQEGGIVSHLAPPLTRLPALSTLAALEPERRTEEAEHYGRIHGQELASLGVTLNFAPVLDLRPEARRNRLDFNTLIGQRDLGRSGDGQRNSAALYPRSRCIRCRRRGQALPGIGAGEYRHPPFHRRTRHAGRGAGGLRLASLQGCAVGFQGATDGRACQAKRDRSRSPGLALPAHRRWPHPKAMALSGRRLDRRSGHGRDLSA
jgi:hypothetical protein